MRILLYILVLVLSSFALLAEGPEPIPVHESKIILNDGAFSKLPFQFKLEDKHDSRWGWGNWDSSYGYADIGFTQVGQELIFTQKGMKAKKILKNWGISDYKLGKKKAFKSDGKRALVHLAEIDNLKCVVVITRFGVSGGDVHSRYRSTLDGYICKNSGDITIEEGMNFLHCIELIGEGTNFLGKSVDSKCKKSEMAENKVDQDIEDNKGDQDIEDNKGDQDIEKKLEKLKSLYDKELITKEEYDQERKEILDEM